MYEAVKLTIQGRSCTMDVMEVPDGIPPLIGQLPLEHLDFVVNMAAISSSAIRSTGASTCTSCIDWRGGARQRKQASWARPAHEA